jgi:Zn-finger nucleic acid-binding protein
MPRCPVCKTPTELIKYEGVPIHNCGGCGGHWLTDVKLDAIVARRDVVMPEPVQRQMIALADASNRPEELHCISCGTAMVKEPFKYWPDIQLDRCPKCNGLWLDRCELEKCQIYWERMQDEPESPAAQRAARIGEVDAQLAGRQYELRDQKDRAEMVRRGRLGWPGVLAAIFSVG